VEELAFRGAVAVFPVATLVGIAAAAAAASANAESDKRPDVNCAYRALPEFILMPAMFGSESSRNAHGVRRALSHYADDVEMSSL